MWGRLVSESLKPRRAIIFVEQKAVRAVVLAVTAWSEKPQHPGCLTCNELAFSCMFVPHPRKASKIQDSAFALQ